MTPKPARRLALTVACVLALLTQTIPPTWNFGAPAADCEWDVVPNAPRPARIRVALNSGYAFGGNDTALVLRAG